jgi:hypothetical protein
MSFDCTGFCLSSQHNAQNQQMCHLPVTASVTTNTDQPLSKAQVIKSLDEKKEEPVVSGDANVNANANADADVDVDADAFLTPSENLRLIENMFSILKQVFEERELNFQTLTEMVGLCIRMAENATVAGTFLPSWEKKKLVISAIRYALDRLPNIDPLTKTLIDDIFLKVLSGLIDSLCNLRVQNISLQTVVKGCQKWWCCFSSATTSTDDTQVHQKNVNIHHQLKLQPAQLKLLNIPSST